MPKYTEEQVERARNADVRLFLEQIEGFSFKDHGRYLKCANPQATGQPSSLSVDTSMNRIFYNSQTGNKPLSAIDWCKEIRNMDFQSSMELVLGENPQGELTEKPKYQPYKPYKTAQPPKATVKKDFELPQKSDSHSNVYAYLTKTRGVSSHIVNSCLKQNLIFQDTNKNAVFVGFDDENKAKYAARRGTYTPDGREPFKLDAVGSDKGFAFKMVGKDTDTIYVTEAAIDALSLASIEDKINGQWSHKNKTYISTGGAGVDNAIEQFCKTHNVKSINVCFDNDEAGQKGMQKIMEKYRNQGYEVNDMRATLAHDYNDELLAYNQNQNFYSEPPLPVKKVSITHERNIDTVPNQNIPPEPEQLEYYNDFSIDDFEELPIYNHNQDFYSEPPLPVENISIPPKQKNMEDFIYSYSNEQDIPLEDIQLQLKTELSIDVNYNEDDKILSEIKNLDNPDEKLKMAYDNKIPYEIDEPTNLYENSNQFDKARSNAMNEQNTPKSEEIIVETQEPIQTNTQHEKKEKVVVEEKLPPNEEIIVETQEPTQSNTEHEKEENVVIEEKTPQNEETIVETQEPTQTNTQHKKEENNTVVEENLPIKEDRFIEKQSKPQAQNQDVINQNQQQQVKQDLNQSVIFGNTSYNKIENKEHINKIDNSISSGLLAKLHSEKIAFSGKFANDGLIVVVSKDDKEKVQDIIKEQLDLIKEKSEPIIEDTVTSIPKKEKQIIENVEVTPKEKQQVSVKTENSHIKTEISEEEILQLKPQEKMNALLAFSKDKQEAKRANILDKIDVIDGKIDRQQDNLQKLDKKIENKEISIKTTKAFARAFKNTPISKLLENRIEKQQEKIKNIKDVKIPKCENKIAIQTAKKDKQNVKLTKVNRKIDKIDKLQDFFTSITSKDKEKQHKGFVKGLEDLSDIRKENLENKQQKIENKIAVLTDKFQSNGLTNVERREISKDIQSLEAKSQDITKKLECMDKLKSDLTDMRNNKFTDYEMDTTIEKTADKISEKFADKTQISDKGIVNHIIDETTTAGQEAINETSAEKVRGQIEKANPQLERILEEKHPQVSKNEEQEILTCVAISTGIDISEINRLPQEVKNDIIVNIRENSGVINSEELTTRICDMADIEPPNPPIEVNTVVPNQTEQQKEKINPLRELEDMLEENDNHFDGMLNNLPPEKEKPKEQDIQQNNRKSEPLFSRSKVMSDDFKPTERAKENNEKTKSKSQGMEI